MKPSIGKLDLFSYFWSRSLTNLLDFGKNVQLNLGLRKTYRNQLNVKAFELIVVLQSFVAKLGDIAGLRK